jgi:glycosyltransferase involved in cell wall biosynthesis
MTTRLVSVIIPVYNRGNRLRDAVMSVLLQTYAEIEIIIIDDGSTDCTYNIAKSLARKWQKTISVYWQPNAGPGPARELGRQKSSGLFIQYLDSDDILLPRKFSTQVQALLRNPTCSIAYGISYEQDFSFNPPLLRGPIRDTGIQNNHLFPKLLNERWWTTSSPLYRQDILLQTGAWKNLLNEEDWEYDGRIGALEAVLIWVPYEVSVRRLNLTHDHLSQGGCTDPRKIADRVKSKHFLYQYALLSGVQHRQREMELFARECFFLSRQCATLDLEKEAKMMFNLARKASNLMRKYGLDFLLYRLFGYLMGWHWTARLTSKLRNML